MWFEERALRITASNVGTIVHMTERKNKTKFAESLINPKPFKALATEWGKTNEKNAVLEYRRRTTNKVISCGLFISTENCYLAGTPDGLVGNLTVLEVKCPFAIRDEEINEQNLNYLERVGNKLYLKTDSKYYYQVQTQMYVTGREFCDFCVWTKKDFKLISVERNNEVIKSLIIPRTKSFYEDYVVPALVKKKFC